MLPFLLCRHVPVTFMMALQRCAGPSNSPSYLNGIQSSFLMGWAPCCSPTSPSGCVLSGSMLRCHLVQVYFHHLHSRVTLNSVHHIVGSGDYPIWEGWSLGDFHLVPVGRYSPHLVIHFVACRVGQMVACSHFVVAQLQMLVGVVGDVM